jgi:PAS domain-containing protein
MNSEEHNIPDARLLRIKAEKQLKENQKAMDTSVLESDVKKLMHELQVHQIELEMQNEELMKANEIAEAALKKYTMLYDFAPMGYFTLDVEGTILELNFTGAEMLEDKRVSLVGSNFKLFVSDLSKPEFAKFFKRVYTSNSKESCEIMLGYENDHSCFVYIEGIVLRGDTNCILSLVDISSFRKD